MGIFFEVNRLSISQATHTSILDLLHEAEQSPDPTNKHVADHYLHLALQLQESQLEARLLLALRALRASNWSAACVELACALRTLPKQEHAQALIVKAVAATDPKAALLLIDAFLDDFPESQILWPMYWSIARSLGQAKFLEEAMTRLPEVSSGKELSAIFQLLAIYDNAPKQVGVCQFDPETLMVSGWALDREHPQRASQLLIESGVFRGQLSADDASGLLRAAGLSSVVGGFKIKLVKPLESLRLTFSDGSPLVGSPVAALAPVLLPPNEFNPTAPRSELLLSVSALQLQVSVLVPVYSGRSRTLECLQSLIKAQPLNKVAHEIIVLDDASPDVELSADLAQLATKGQITLIRRPANLGFIRNMNRGMLLHQDRDVVWLNADTRVTGDWLDRLQGVAYSDSLVASVTPLSNNGELTSFPRMRFSSPMPSEAEQRELDQMMRHLNLPAEELFVGCGFCFYLKRSALNDVGLLDEQALYRGYGEETEWCLRAHGRGWRHVAAVNVFVAHSGGASFGRAKRSLVYRNNSVIKRRYPLASEHFDRFVRADNLQGAREAIQRERIRQSVGQPDGTLIVYESQGDEMLRSQPMLTRFDSDKIALEREFVAQAAICLSWTRQGIELEAQLSVKGVCPEIVLNYRLPRDTDLFKRDLKMFAPTEYAIVDTADLPAMLTPCLKSLKKIKFPIQAHTAAMTKSRRAMPDTKSFSTNKKSSHSPGLGALGLIVDDLSDPAVAQQWLSHIGGDAQLIPGSLAAGKMRLMAVQDTPLVAQLEKHGFAVLAYFPKGLSVEHWLRLFGVSHLVSCIEQDSPVFSTVFDRFFSRLQEPAGLDRLPRLSAHTWLGAVQASRQSDSNTPYHSTQEIA